MKVTRVITSEEVRVEVEVTRVITSEEVRVEVEVTRVITSEEVRVEVEEVEGKKEEKAQKCAKRNARKVPDDLRWKAIFSYFCTF